MNLIGKNPVNDIITTIAESKVLILIILLASILVLFFSEFVTSIKYKIGKNIELETFDIKQLENIIISILETWNTPNLKEAEIFYTRKLLRKHKKHLQQNYLRDISEHFYEIRIEGLNKLVKHRNSISLEVSYQAKVSRYYGKMYNDYLGISRFGSRAMLQKDQNSPITSQKFAQKWHFIICDNSLKVDNFTQTLPLN